VVIYTPTCVQLTNVCNLLKNILIQMILNKNLSKKKIFEKKNKSGTERVNRQHRDCSVRLIRSTQSST